MRIFVSHASEDKPLALALTQLPSYVQAWVDIHKLLPGELLSRTISLAIEDSHVFIVLLGQVSTSKVWVVEEVKWALAREARKDRVFVLPILIDAELTLADCAAPFGALADRLFINACDRSEAGVAASRARLAHTLSHWLSDWIDELEPPGDGNLRFVEQIERDLVEYQVRLHEVKAVLAWPLPVLVKDDAVAHLIAAKDRYNEFTDAFIPRLTQLDDELRWRFGGSAQRAFAQLAIFIRNEVYHGAAFALNDVIESVNAYDDLLKNDPIALAEAEARREQRVAALEPVMTRLVNRTSDYISTLKP